MIWGLVFETIHFTSEFLEVKMQIKVNSESDLAVLMIFFRSSHKLNLNKNC